MQTACTPFRYAVGTFSVCLTIHAWLCCMWTARWIVLKLTACKPVILLQQMSGQQRQQQHAAVHRRPQVAVWAAAETIPTGETDVAEGETYEVNVRATAAVSVERVVFSGACCISKAIPHLK